MINQKIIRPIKNASSWLIFVFLFSLILLSASEVYFQQQADKTKTEVAVKNTVVKKAVLYPCAAPEVVSHSIVEEKYFFTIHQHTAITKLKFDFLQEQFASFHHLLQSSRPTFGKLAEEPFQLGA